MLQPDTALPTVAMTPAPWSLTGGGWVVIVRLPEGDPARRAFMPDSVEGEAGGRHSVLMFVDYEESDAGPYHELLFIPGSFRFADGKRHMSISRILVSTWDSVVNGRENWGIPKDRADFDVEYGVDGRRRDHIVVRDGGKVMAELDLAYFPLPVPMLGSLSPESSRTLAQRYRGYDYVYAPSSYGLAYPGKVCSWRFDAALFPDLGGAQVVSALRIKSFRMTFPVAKKLAVEAG